MTTTDDPVGDDPVLHALQRSSALADVGRPDEAEALLRRALADEPDEPFLHTELARVLVVQGRHREAVEQAERASASAPGLAYAHAIRALALLGVASRRFEAVDAARQAVALDPEDPFAHLTLARAALGAGWPDDARAAAEAAIRLDPESGDGHGVLGAVLLEMDRPAEAEAAFRESLRRDPQDAAVLNDLGVALQAQGPERGAEARAYFEESARARPADPLPRGNLATDARSWVTGRWMWALAIYFLIRTVAELVAGDLVGAGVSAAIACGLSAFVVLRARRRQAELSPATQRLLREQRWWERTQITLWRPWFWFVPAPVWLVVALFFVVGALETILAGSDVGPANWALLGVGLVVAAGTGRRTWQRHGASRWARRRRPRG